jgi:hypothetical protein
MEQLICSFFPFSMLWQAIRHSCIGVYEYELWKEIRKKQDSFGVHE